MVAPVPTPSMTPAMTPAMNSAMTPAQEKDVLQLVDRFASHFDGLFEWYAVVASTEATAVATSAAVEASAVHAGEPDYVVQVKHMYARRRRQRGGELCGRHLDQVLYLEQWRLLTQSSGTAYTLLSYTLLSHTLLSHTLLTHTLPSHTPLTHSHTVMGPLKMSPEGVTGTVDGVRVELPFTSLDGRTNRFLPPSVVKDKVGRVELEWSRSRCSSTHSRCCADADRHTVDSRCCADADRHTC
jgi:hypothetical protein